MESAKPRLYLHIGTGKTGTTSIQKFMWANRRLLKKQGILYPRLGVKSGAHHRLSPHIPPFLKDVWTFIPAEEWAPNLAKLGAGGATIAMSSELIISLDPDEVQKFADTIRTWFDVKIIIYLRRIDDHLMASFNQQVKAGMQRASIEQTMDLTFKRIRPDNLLRPWRKAFRPQNVIIRPYNRADFHGGDIHRDFVNVLGASWNDKFTVDESNPNARLGPEALELRRILNNIVRDQSSNDAFLEPLMRWSSVQDTKSQAIFAESTLLPGNVRRALIKRMSQFYETVGLATLLTKLPADTPAWQPVALPNQRIAEIFSQILTRKLRKILDHHLAVSAESNDLAQLLCATRVTNALALLDGRQDDTAPTEDIVAVEEVEDESRAHPPAQPQRSAMPRWLQRP